MKTIYFEKDIPRILITKFAARFFRPLLFTGLNAVNIIRNCRTRLCRVRTGSG